MRIPGKTTCFLFFSFIFLLVPGSLLAAEVVAESVVRKTIIASLEPVMKLFAGNGWLQGSAVILVTFTIASLITWVVFRMVKKVTTWTTIELDDQIALLVRFPVYYTLLVTGISYGFSLMPFADSVHFILTKCIRSLGVVIWIVFISRFASLLLARLATLTHKFTFIQHRTLTLFNNAAKVLIFSIGIYAIFIIWKIDMTAWLASAGIAGIAVGFAAKDTLSNLFSGVFILADAPYKVGDYIVLDRMDRGKVTNIGLRSTRIITRDDVEITIPNSIIGNSTIINQSGGPSEKMRIRVMVGVAYGTDVELARNIMLDIAQKERLVCSSPEPSVRFKFFNASSLDLELRGWIPKPEMRGRCVDALNSAIHQEFQKAGIEIPYAKQDLYIKGLPESFGVPTSVPQSSSRDESQALGEHDQ